MEMKSCGSNTINPNSKRGEVGMEKEEEVIEHFDGGEIENLTPNSKEQRLLSYTKEQQRPQVNVEQPPASVTATSACIPSTTTNQLFTHLPDLTKKESLPTIIISSTPPLLTPKSSKPVVGISTTPQSPSAAITNHITTALLTEITRNTPTNSPSLIISPPSSSSSSSSSFSSAAAQRIGPSVTSSNRILFTPPPPRMESCTLPLQLAQRDDEGLPIQVIDLTTSPTRKSKKKKIRKKGIEELEEVQVEPRKLQRTANEESVLFTSSSSSSFSFSSSSSSILPGSTSTPLTLSSSTSTTTPPTSTSTSSSTLPGLEDMSYDDDVLVPGTPPEESRASVTSNEIGGKGKEPADLVVTTPLQPEKIYITKSWECGICCEPLKWEGTSKKNRACTLRHCGHIWGQDCLERFWKHKKNSKKVCPVCKKVAKASDVIQLYLPESEEGELVNSRELQKFKNELAEMTQKVNTLKAQLQKEKTINSSWQRSQWQTNTPILDIHSPRSGLTITTFKPPPVNSSPLNFNRALNRSPSSPLPPSSSAYFSPSNSTPLLPTSYLPSFLKYEIVESVGVSGARLMELGNNLVIVSYSESPSCHGFVKFNVTDFQNKDRFPNLHKDTIRDMKLNLKDTNMMLSASDDGTLLVTNINNKNQVHRFAAGTAVWSCAWNSQDKDIFYGGLRNGQVLTFDLRQPGTPLETYAPPGFAPGIHSLCFVPHAVLRYAKDCESSSSSQSSQPPSPLTSRILAANSHGVHVCCNSSLSLMNELKGGCSNLVFDTQSNLFSATFRVHSSYKKTSHKIFQLLTNGGGGYDSLTSREHRTIFCTYTVNSPTSRSCLFTTFETVDVRRKILASVDEVRNSVVFWDVESGMELGGPTNPNPNSGPIKDVRVLSASNSRRSNTMFTLYEDRLVVSETTPVH